MGTHKHCRLMTKMATSLLLSLAPAVQIGHKSVMLQKRQKLSSSGASLDTFKTLDIHEKLSVLHSDIQDQNEKVASIEHKVDTCLRLHNRVNTIETNLGDADRRLLLLGYKSIDLESRSRRNNLIFNGFSEDKNENCRIKIHEFLERRLNLEPFAIDRAHRLGRFVRGSNRPIIVAFRDYTAVESVLSSAYKLKGSHYSINRDFPKEIVDARKSLWRQYKMLKSEHPNSKVSLVYPAKLMKDGQVVEDRFPLWNGIMSGSRTRTNQRPQMVPQSNGVNPREAREHSNTRPNYAQTAASTQGDRLIEHEPRAADPNPANSTRSNSSSPAPHVRNATPGRQDRSRSPPRRIGTPNRRSRAPSRYQASPTQNQSQQESQIHRPWDQNGTDSSANNPTVTQ